MTGTYYRSWENLYAPRDLARGPLLVVVPHPDDEVIGAGGLVLAHRDAGEPVTCVVMTDGRLGDFSGRYGDEYPEIRKAECRAAAEALGGLETVFLDFPDMGLAAALEREDRAPVERLAEILRSRAWATVAMPSPWELHPDHRAASLAAFRAVAGLADRPRILAYEVGTFMPGNLLLDTTALFERKIAALRCYASQIEHHDLVGKVTGVDVARTANVDDRAVERCEAYLRVDPLRIDEFLDAVERAARVGDEMGPGVPYD